MVRLLKCVCGGWICIRSPGALWEEGKEIPVLLFSPVIQMALMEGHSTGGKRQGKLVWPLHWITLLKESLQDVGLHYSRHQTSANSVLLTANHHPQERVV
jgi:hypothetical protein